MGNRPTLKAAMRGDLVSVQFRERLMLMVTEVNGCRYCSYGHSKAALAAGLSILLKKLGLEPEDIAHVYISGAFGSYINLENVLRTGMMDFPPDRFHKRGNTALMGAKMFLFSGEDLIGKILSISSHVNLESEKDFQDVFVSRLSFNPASR